MSGDGDVIALGVRDEVHPGADIDYEWMNGAVYLFRRTSSGWVREQKLVSTWPEDEFRTAGRTRRLRDAARGVASVRL